MDRLTSFFDSQFVYALGWTIVHSFWQSLIVFTLLSLSLFMCQRSRPEIRYGLSTVALLCCFLISVKTFVYCYQDVAQASQLFTQLHTTITTTQVQNWWTSTFTTINPWLDTIVLFWCVGFIIQGMRYVYDISLTQRLKTQAVYQLPDEWNERLQSLVRKLGITKPVIFMHSTKINVPSVIGHFKPVILLPLGILTQLPQAHVEAIVLHELAHVRRHDYLINIVLCLIKVLFFFNPFVLAISKKISIERENICDDLAVKACGDPLTFANSLSQFADVTPVSQSAMAASKDKYLLLDRVKRLFPNRGKLSTTTERLIALICAGILGLTLNVNAKNQPVLAAFESTPMQLEPMNVRTEQDTYPKTAGETPSSNSVFIEPDMSTKNAGNQVRGTNEIIVSSGSTDNLTVSVKPTEPTGQNNKSLPDTITATPTFSEKSQQETTVLLAQNNPLDASSAARNYLESANKNVKATKTEVTESHETIQTHQQQLTGRVYANTDKFSSFSLESPNALANIDQIIFAPISTSDTEFSVGARKWRDVVSHYFSEVQSQKPRVITLNSNGLTTADFTGLNSSLIAQIRIKDVKWLGVGRGTGVRNWPNIKRSYYDLRSILQKKRDAQRVANLQKSQDSTSTLNIYDINTNTPILTSLSSKANLTKKRFFLEVITEVVFVDATTYEYVGSGLKKIWLDSANVEPDLLTLARHEGSPTNSRTQTERNADIIKNMWDILLSHLQNDVYQVATAIKNQELELSLSGPTLETQPASSVDPTRNLASQYYSVGNSEFEQFIVSSPDSLYAFKNATYTPVVIEDVQLKSKHSGWKERAANSLTHIAGQTGLTYDLGNNELSSSLQASTGSEENLLVQIEVKSLDLYSRSANRTYRNVTALGSRGSNYNRGASATGTGLSPSKDDVGGATVRKDSVAMSRAFDTKQYLRGRFEITILDPVTHQVLGYVTSETTINPSHGAYRRLAEQIIGQNLGVQQEDILLLALFEKVKTHLHDELLLIQQGEMSVKPIQLTTELANSLTENPLVRTQAGPEATVAKLIN
jgi:beta-lactamase regulating signal transducer with metallopeptidase domain